MPGAGRRAEDQPSVRCDRPAALLQLPRHDFADVAAVPLTGAVHEGGDAIEALAVGSPSAGEAVGLLDGFRQEAEGEGDRVLSLALAQLQLEAEQARPSARVDDEDRTRF